MINFVSYDKATEEFLWELEVPRDVAEVREMFKNPDRPLSEPLDLTRARELAWRWFGLPHLEEDESFVIEEHP